MICQRVDGLIFVSANGYQSYLYLVIVNIVFVHVWILGNWAKFD